MNIESLFGVQGGVLTIDLLRQFILTQPEENLHLEFKSGAFFDASNRDNITAAVTSFANSDGGVLMIGVREKKFNGKSYAESIDGVQVDPKHTKEALENILISSISPKIDSLQILRLENNGTSIFILEIPKSERAPHMASDKRYYKRLNFQKIPMENYEVEDYMFGRKKTPILTAKFNFSDGKVQNNLLSFSVEVLIRNLGRIMARYVLLTLEIKGVSVVSPIPQGFKVLKQDQNETVLQFGPSANGALPVVVMPSPSEQERWTTFGKLKIQASSTTQIGFITYRLIHEELPETTGQFGINLGNLQPVLSGQSTEISAPNERVLY